LYAANSDNFLTINDQVAASQPLDLLLVPPAGGPWKPAADAAAQIVQAPTHTGALLMRVLTTDYEKEKTTVEAARRSLRCTAMP
jgi:uncharacterized membrane protein